MKLAPSLQDRFMAAGHGCVRFDEPMRLHTTFRIGGPAQIWAEPQGLEELQALLRAAADERLAVTVVGGGANLLVRDEGIPGLVIHLKQPAFQGCRRSSQGMAAGAGIPIEGLIHRAQAWALSGLEFLAGVPGRLGGAVRMNAGTHDDEGRLHSVSDVVETVTMLRLDGTVERVQKEKLGFGYRDARLGEGIVLEAELQLPPDDPEAIARRVKRLWEFKKRSQDWSAPSVGCIFKNPVTPLPSFPLPLGEREGVRGIPSAGWLIDQAGFKGRRIGGAEVSSAHANFIMNVGQATAADVLALIQEVRGQVFRKFNVNLELEVQVLPE